ncbi:tRNA pseudouridine synthase D [Piedraia hortae CBS 480.64]|uniref:tRNA pseudouridine synthase D n=1 Tax=Piedraia hortae CBS 480.64 TaxID=1314780 RepID=A0A6A7C3W7_9PEZI|nr:tRNA pseudouridine synthase D [Piedraia hortae CBS 480.64]
MAKKHKIEGDWPPSKRVRSDATVNDAEETVGITAYVSPDVQEFTCVFKQRYTDFLVNEISTDGSVLHLTDLSVPRSRVNEKANGKEKIEQQKELVEEVAEKQEKQENKDAPENVEISDKDKSSVQEIFGAETTEKILKLYAAILKAPNKKPRDHVSIKSPVISEKDKRTQAHIAVRKVFNSKLQTETLQDEVGVILIKAAPIHQKDGQKRNLNRDGAVSKGKLAWDELGGEFLHFTLYKENKDTMEVLYFIATQLRVAVKNFQFAGTKDRRGVTVQRIAVFRVHADRIASLNKVAKGWVASGFSYHKKGLELGELAGNEFTLTLRDCHFEDEEENRLETAKKVVAHATKSFESKGFLNYYGLQRFGTYSTGTHTTGMRMLQGDLEGAVDSILTYSPDVLSDESRKVPQEDIDRAKAIRTWRETGTVSYVPKRYQAEHSIMQYLSKKDKRSGTLVQANDYQGALMTIQRNLRMMYVHSYQSLVWNTIVGKRWEMYGDKVIEGDLVIVGEKEEQPAENQVEEVDEDGEPIFHPAEHDQAASAEDKFTRARPLSKAEAESGRFDIYDIVLPLPGFDVIYPSNAIGKFYEEFMGSEAGGGLDPHNMRRAWKDASLSGGYRKMMARASDVDAKVVAYSAETEQLVLTDLEKVRGRSLLDRDDNIVGDKIAVVVKFKLGSSQYATMALRELTRGGATAYKPDYSSR